MKTFLKILAVFLLLYVGLGALYGSWMLLSDPGGGKFYLSTGLLKNSPFHDYLIPGIILLLFNGLLPLFIVVAVFLKTKNHPRLIILQGLILIGWLTVELLINPAFFVPYLHYSLYASGVILVIIGLVSMKTEKRPSSTSKSW
ncbi:MAG: hypothetical protein IH595_11845 [Bacteroidales bacterium]|nr:hypothetical protein [Bacteroidales bacterium]